MEKMQFYFLDGDEKLIGIMKDAVECKVNEAQYTASMQFPISNDFSFENCSYIGFYDLDDNLVFYEIKSFKVNDRSNIVKFSCEIAAMSELLDKVVTGKSVTGAQAGYATSRVIEDTRWQLQSAETTGTMSTTFWYTNVWECLQMIREATGCEHYFSYALSGNQITARYINVKARAGEARGKRFEMTKDIKGIEVVYDKSAIYTKLYGRGKGVEVGTTQSGDPTYGRRLDFGDVVWSTSQGDPMNKPADQLYIEDTAATALFGRGPAGSKIARENTVIFEDCTDPEELLQLTYEKLMSTRYPVVRITAKVIDLERYFGYAYEAIRKGDDVVVIFDEYGISVQDKIVNIVRDYLRPENTEVTIGKEGTTSYSRTAKMSSTIERIKEQADIGSHVASANPSLIRGVIDTMMTSIMSSGTGISTDPVDGSIILTTNDGLKAIKLTGGGILLANSKTSGAWNWGTAITGDGIGTGYLTAGVINASLIKILGTNQFYWDSSNIYIQDPSNTNKQLRIGLYDGTHYGIAFTVDGGAHWSAAIDFDGVHVEQGETKGVYVQSTAPTNPPADAIWLNTTNNTFYKYSSGEWGMCVADADVSSDINTATATLREYIDQNVATAAQFRDLQGRVTTLGTILSFDESGELSIVSKIRKEFQDADEADREEYQDVIKAVRVVDGTIYLGDSSSDITLTVENDSITFRQKGVPIAQFTNDSLISGNVVIKRNGILQIGDFGFIPEQDGSLSFVKIGGA